MTRSDRTFQAIVVGAGISGLVTAWRLKKAGVDVGLLEIEKALGGCMRTEKRDGLILEKGPFNVLVRDDAFRNLLDECAGEVATVTASEAGNARFLYRKGVLHEVPMGPGGLIGTPLLSFGAKTRLLTGMLFSRPARNDEPTIAEAARRRLGAEVADTFISSIVAGVFGGDSRRLSLKACFPKAWQFDRRKWSPLLYEMKVLREKRRRLQADPELNRYRGLISFRDGLQALPDWLGRQLGDGLLPGRRVVSIEQYGGSYRLHCLRNGRGTEETFSCRHLVLATPAPATSRLLQPLAPEASDILDSIQSASLVVLNLAYREEDVGHPMQGYGFLVPASEGDMPVMGVLWADSAFPHHGREGTRIIRVFMGGPRDAQATERSDAELLDIATSALRGPLQLAGEPSLVDICRWPRAIPQYHVGHLDRVQRIESEISILPRLYVIGSYLRGVSINDCVREATELGERLAGDIMAERTSAAAARLNGTPASGAGRQPAARASSRIDSSVA
ncbi:MAG: protoporphyrinogen oxidase [Phycisphaerales bacterium]|nr:MAG: protoporphyrinogen oxidase [Phycisphaerales bacterium]